MTQETIIPENQIKEQAKTESRRDVIINAGIAGGAGYTGGELLRLLVHHPQVNISFVHSRSHAGKVVHDIHRDLEGDTELVFTGEDAVFSGPVDVLFLCLGHGESKKFLEQHEIAATTRIIDLSQDFRLKETAQFQNRQFVYGLPELNRNIITAGVDVANPGCFATAIQLGLLPLAEAGMLDEVYTTGITGSTGAGQSLSASSHFSWRANNVQAYKSLTHQHLKEVYQSLHRLQESFPAAPAGEKGSAINFIPWRGDFTRGIFVSSTLTCEEKVEDLVELYINFYKGHPFTLVNRQEIFLKQVVNTNKCVIHLEKAGSKLVVHSAIDNLLKGASGQAVQNMNILFGLDEKAGLKLKATGF